MPTPPSEIIPLLATFAKAFTAPAFAKAQVLMFGAILAPGRRTVASALRAVGLAGEQQFGKYHGLLNRDRWSPFVLSQLLLALIIDRCLKPGDPLVILTDETLERRSGRRIRYKGWFRDAARSTALHVQIALGIRWLCLAILVPVPWSTHAWALPFLVFPCLSAKTAVKLHKHARPLAEWTGLMIERVRRWHPTREIIVVGDSAYATFDLVAHCQKLNPPVKLVSRLRLDARLYAFPAAQRGRRRGRVPQKGPREAALADRLRDALRPWFSVALPWYAEGSRTVSFQTGRSLWYRIGTPPLPIHWVLVRCPQKPSSHERFQPAAFFCSDLSLQAEQIIALYIARWQIEVTFEEIRACLGFETQRQWSDRAIERTTPCLFGLFSLIVLFARACHGQHLPVRSLPWYTKPEPTFSDVLAAVRRDLWLDPNCIISPTQPDTMQLPMTLALSLIDSACYST